MRAEQTMPEVSVVIPALNRPEMLERAIRSVLAQSFQDFEILVVIDGPEATVVPAAIEAMDGRVKAMVLGTNVGLAEARNEGIRSARGRWIALLDDDDEWLERKLDRQWRAAIGCGGEYVFAPCKFLEKTLTMERVMPERLPEGADRFSEYIYCEQGYLQPSMYFMSRALCLEVPFTKGLRHIEDSDWLLRASRHPKIQIKPVDEVLSIYYNYKDGRRESEGTPWQHPLRWGVNQHELFTRRAFPFFVARLGLNARRAGEPISVLFHLIGTARRYGSLSSKSLAYFMAYWFLPDHALRRLRAAFR